MHNAISRRELELLANLLEHKLQKLDVLQQSKNCTDNDLNLTESLLKFVQYLVSKEQRLADAHNNGWTSYYSAPVYNTGAPSGGGGFVATAGFKPTTICSNCWAKNQSHTHCTHMLDDELVQSTDAVSGVFIDKFTKKT